MAKRQRVELLRSDPAFARFQPLLRRLALRAGLDGHAQRAAANILNRASAHRLLRGRPIGSMAAAALYAAARADGNPIPLSRLAALTQRDRAEVGRYYRILSVGLKLCLLPAAPGDHLGGLCEILGLPSNVHRRASELLAAAGPAGSPPGRSPPAIAAAALYVVAPLEGRRVTEKAAADAARITEVTIRTAARDLRTASGWRFPPRSGPSPSTTPESVRGLPADAKTSKRRATTPEPV